MDELSEKFLPIGTVVILKGGKKRMMITGYAQVDVEKKDKVYDYIGCMYPEGVISTNQNLLFNHDEIENIYFLGYSDDDQKKYSSKLKELLTEENIKRMLDSVKKN